MFVLINQSNKFNLSNINLINEHMIYEGYIEEKKNENKKIKHKSAKYKIFEDAVIPQYKSESGDQKLCTEEFKDSYQEVDKIDDIEEAVRLLKVNRKYIREIPPPQVVLVENVLSLLFDDKDMICLLDILFKDMKGD
jgi:hypothetical protein